jgi:hypothetical protein
MDLCQYLLVLGHFGSFLLRAWATEGETRSRKRCCQQKEFLETTKLIRNPEKDPHVMETRDVSLAMLAETVLGLREIEAGRKVWIEEAMNNLKAVIAGLSDLIDPTQTVRYAAALWEVMEATEKTRHRRHSAYLTGGVEGFGSVPCEWMSHRLFKQLWGDASTKQVTERVKSIRETNGSRNARRQGANRIPKLLGSGPIGSILHVDTNNGLYTTMTIHELRDRAAGALPASLNSHN